jgi:chorismate mutase
MTTEQSIDELRFEIDSLDGEILNLIKVRTEISRTIGEIRRKQGGNKIDPTREKIIYDKYIELGEEGKALVDILLQLGRGTIY